MITGQKHRHWWKVTCLIVLFLFVMVSGLLALRFLADEPVEYADDEEPL